MGISSIRGNEQYRIEFTVERDGLKPVLYICNILNCQIIIDKNCMITLEGVDPRMIANNLTPFIPTHPGDILKEEIEYRGISQRRLAKEMGVSYSVLNEILNGKRPVTAEYALLFEATLGIEAGIFIRMQADYDMQAAKRDKSFAARLDKIRQVAAFL